MRIHVGVGSDAKSALTGYLNRTLFLEGEAFGLARFKRELSDATFIFARAQSASVREPRHRFSRVGYGSSSG